MRSNEGRLRTAEALGATFLEQGMPPVAEAVVPVLMLLLPFHTVRLPAATTPPGPASRKPVPPVLLPILICPVVSHREPVPVTRTLPFAVALKPISAGPLELRRLPPRTLRAAVVNSQ